MKRGRLLVADGAVLAVSADLTGNIWERMRGLLGRPPLCVGEVLVIDPCNAVHTVGMRYALDLLFLDRQWRVRRFVAAVAPGCLCVAGGRHAQRVVEAASGWLDARLLTPGTQLAWQPGAAD